MKYYLIAGESSGDQHAAYLMKSLKKLDSSAEFRYWGGDRMKEVGDTDPVRHIDDLAFMGFWEVAVNIRTILKNLKLAKRDIAKFSPDYLILVDYPGFNLRIAEWAHKKKMKVVYYIAPQVWAWKENRVKKIRRHCDLLLTILPFEEDYFKDKGVVQAKFIGHPLMDHFDTFKANADGFDPSEKLFGIFPGSRRQEVNYILPPVSAVFQKYPDTQFGLSVSDQLRNSPELYHQHLNNAANVKRFTGRQHDLLAHSEAALVKSGTSTLEAALLNVAQTVIYKGNPVSFFIAKRVVKVPYISLVNLILGYKLVEELIQSDVNEKNLDKAVELLKTPEEQERQKAGYKELREKLGGPGASDRAARAIVQL
ncbi:MAG: lipid-A-disaccharide synthase [Saprospirales bacterium]|nr:MAG: lipid-A-disaccharide synthase [Saprospirales bacterium]